MDYPVVIEICIIFFFFFNDTATTEIYTLSLHDALPICACFHRSNSPFQVHLLPNQSSRCPLCSQRKKRAWLCLKIWTRSEEHTSELQSRQYLVCRLLLEKKKQIRSLHYILLVTFHTYEK